jgi:hypothetical protein
MPAVDVRDWLGNERGIMGGRGRGDDGEDEMIGGRGNCAVGNGFVGAFLGDPKVISVEMGHVFAVAIKDSGM